MVLAGLAHGVGDTGLADPLGVVPALGEVCAVARGVSAEIVVVAKSLEVRAGVFGSGIYDLRLIRELGKDGLLLLGVEDVPGLGAEEEVLDGG